LSGQGSRATEKKIKKRYVKVEGWSFTAYAWDGCFQTAKAKIEFILSFNLNRFSMQISMGNEGLTQTKTI
jgi:hypothetical protein